MPIDFHDQQNRATYTTRMADPAWSTLIQTHAPVRGKIAADIGCGGGIYTQALCQLGAAHVTGVDFSAAMLQGATEHCAEIDNVAFVQGNAYDTGLPAQHFDTILARALIHHLDDLDRCFGEARRLLKAGGTLIVQDRTPQDCLLPGSATHLRGYFFEKFPKLIDIEVARRHSVPVVRATLDASGFIDVTTAHPWETRRTYSDLATLRQDILQRTGRSILHELSDAELQELVAHIEVELAHSPRPIIEQDAWTIWFATKSDTPRSIGREHLPE